MNRFLLIAIFLCVVSCKEVTFKESQPRGKQALKDLPKELRGRYAITSSEDGEQDTVIVTAKGFYVTGDSTETYLSDTRILKKYSGYYFVNDFQDPQWMLRVIKRENNGDLSYLALEPDKISFNDYLVELNKEIRIDSMERNGGMIYQIDPTPKELLNLLAKGYFRKSLTLRKLPAQNP